MAAGAATAACSPRAQYDVVLRNGQIFDGGGAAPFSGNLVIQGDRIAALGVLEGARGRTEIDVI